MQARSGLFTLLSASTLALLLQGCGEATTEAPPANPEASTGGAPIENTAAAMPAADQAAASMYSSLDGQPIDIADYAGKNVFVNYWATWCAPCIKEIPSIARAAEALGDDYVVLLASDESLDTIKEFLLDREFSGTFVKLNGYVGAIGINVMPTSVLYDASGAQVRSWEGSFEWDSPEMLAQLRSE